MKYLLSKPIIGKDEMNNVKKVLESGWLSYGKYSQKLETAFKKKINSKHVIAVNSCTSGIHACLVANNIKQNDEVITSPFTFVSTINSVYQQKTKIVLCDISLEDYNIDISDLKKKINSNTKCILPTHYAGNPCDILEILKLKKKNKSLKIIEDAATAIGAKIDNKYVGSYDTNGCVFSLYANKVITSGEGGLISTNDDKLDKKIKNIIFCGINKNTYKRTFSKNSWQYSVNNLGYKYNISDINAAVALAQVKKLNNIIDYRKRLYDYYDHNFSELFGEGIINKIKINKLNRSANYIYTILLNPKKLKINRNRLIEELTKVGIGTSVHYIPANRHNFYKKIFSKFKLKNTNYVYNNILSIPLHNHLNKKDTDFISNKIKSILIKNYKKK
jgi:perosamine synthetase|tara:strand:+ start:104 stop:1270 length:1167 start_codon:yes stop_codon:yes gene_type:complete